MRYRPVTTTRPRRQQDGGGLHSAAIHGHDPVETPWCHSTTAHHQRSRTAPMRQRAVWWLVSIAPEWCARSTLEGTPGLRSRMRHLLANDLITMGESGFLPMDSTAAWLPPHPEPPRKEGRTKGGAKGKLSQFNCGPSTAFTGPWVGGSSGSRGLPHVTSIGTWHGSGGSCARTATVSATERLRSPSVQGDIGRKSVKPSSSCYPSENLRPCDSVLAM